MKYILLFSSFCLLASCANKPASQQSTTADIDIFNKQTIATLLSAGGNKADADKYYIQAETRLRKEKQPTAAVELFISSLKAYPSAKGYFELGNAYMDSKDYNNAVKAYNIAEQLDYKPLSKLLYNTACAYSLSDNGRKAGEYLEYAIESGYSNAAHITSDPDLASLQSGFAYDDTYLDAMSGSNDPAELLWSSFKKAFKTIALPATIDLQSSRQLESKPALSYKYGRFVGEMQDRAKFSREGGNNIYGYAIVADNASYTTVIYAVQAPTYDDTAAQAAYWLVSYNPVGTQVDKMYIAGQRDLSPICRVFTMNADLTFQVKEFKNTYEKPVEQNGTYDNKIVTTELKSTKEYKLGDNGKFIEAPPRLGMR